MFGLVLQFTPGGVDYLDQVRSVNQKLEDTIPEEVVVGRTKWICIFLSLIDWTHLNQVKAVCRAGIVNIENNEDGGS